MKIKPYLLSLLALAVSVPAFASVENVPETRRPDKVKVAEVYLEATVKAIDYATREVTLVGPNDEMVTLTASDAVKRLNEVKVGDTVTVLYKTMFTAEFRDPTPYELENPLMILAEAEKASLLEDPGAYAGAIVKAVVVVKQIILDSGLVTIKGPQGNYLTIPVEDKELLNQLEVGEKVIMTYAEAMAITLDRVAK